MFVAVPPPSHPCSRSSSRPPSPSGPHSDHSPGSAASLNGCLSVAAAQSAPSSPRPPSVVRAEDDHETSTDEPHGVAAAEFFLSRQGVGLPRDGRPLKDNFATEPTSAGSALLQRFERLCASLSLPTPTPPVQLLQQLNALHDELTGASEAQIASEGDSLSKQLAWLRLNGFRLLLAFLHNSFVHHGRTATSSLQLQASLLRLLRLLWARRQALAAQQRQFLLHQRQQQSEVQADSEAEARRCLL